MNIEYAFIEVVRFKKTLQSGDYCIFWEDKLNKIVCTLPEKERHLKDDEALPNEGWKIVTHILGQVKRWKIHNLKNKD